MREYEDKLELVFKFQQTKQKLREIESIARESTDSETAEQVTRLAEEIYDII